MLNNSQKSPKIVGDRKKPTPNCSQFSAQQLGSLRSLAIFKNLSENKCGKTAKHPATERKQEVLSGKGPQFHHTGKHILNLLMKFSEPSPVLNLCPVHHLTEHTQWWNIISSGPLYMESAIPPSSQVLRNKKALGSLSSAICRRLFSFASPSHPQTGQSRMIKICPYYSILYLAITPAYKSLLYFDSN